MPHPYWPLFDLSIRTPRLELRYPDDALLDRAVELSTQGIHDPADMPFGVAWTDKASPLLERNSMQHYWHNRATHKAEEWHMPLVVLVDSAVVGVQACQATNFAATRVASTGSWLGRAFQGQGIGKEMRSAIVHFLFAGLGAQRCESGAWHDNGPSLGVSRSLGYVENGDAIAMRRSTPDRQIRLLLTRDVWEARRRDDIEILNLEPSMEFLVASGDGSATA